jgi:hypothetical protein
MARPSFIEINGTRLSWRELLDKRREQLRNAAPAEQPALFELRNDSKPEHERTAQARYREPSLFTLLDAGRLIRRGSTRDTGGREVNYTWQRYPRPFGRSVGVPSLPGPARSEQRQSWDQSARADNSALFYSAPVREPCGDLRQDFGEQHPRFWPTPVRAKEQVTEEHSETDSRSSAESRCQARSC